MRIAITNDDGEIMNLFNIMDALDGDNIRQANEIEALITNQWEEA